MLPHISRCLAEQRKLVTIQTMPWRPDTSYTLGIGDINSVAGQHAVAVERAVFTDTFGASDQVHHDNYARYDSTSLFAVITDTEGTPVGSARIIVPGEPGLKSAADAAELWDLGQDALLTAGERPAHPNRTWDIATLAVLRTVPSRAVSFALFQAVTILPLRAGVERLISIFDVRFKSVAGRRTRNMFQTLPGCGPRSYIGSLSVPVYCDLSDYVERLHLHPELRANIIDGRPVGPVAPVDWDAASAAVTAMFPHLTNTAGN